MTNFLVTWNLVFLCVFFDAVGIFLIKLKINVLGPIPSSITDSASYFATLLTDPLTLLGAVMFMLAPFCFAAALSRMDITTAYPVQITLNLFVLVLLSSLFLEEDINIYRWIGLSFAVLCTYFFVSSDSKDANKNATG